MEEISEKQGMFSRIATMLARNRHDDEEEELYETRPSVTTSHSKTHHRYHVTVRRQILVFQDAVAAADGLKRGEQQVLNLSLASPELREKIKDFMCGVNYAAEGTWEELGENVYLLAPAFAFVEVAPSSPRTIAGKN